MLPRQLTALGGSSLLRSQSSLVSLSGFCHTPYGCKGCGAPRQRHTQRLQVTCRGTAQRTQQRNPGQGQQRKRNRLHIQSNGKEHLGSALKHQPNRPFPGPPAGTGPPLRILPVGGLGEIGMNCMLVGVYDRYILIDAGLMFPDFTDLGMQKILPDTTFLSEWRDKIEAVVITHGHEDHIGALPWVIPALDPNTPIYAGAFTMRLIRRRAQEYNLWNESRFRTFQMRTPFQAGPFEISPLRVTHSIPDCCGLILRSDHGTIVHTGDWKIEEDPVDGELFDRTVFEQIGKEGATLFMSDSTNVLSPGRTIGEESVARNIMRRVQGHNGKGRIITTQFASNIHRLHAVKAAADATGRRICFVGMSLHTYLDAAYNEGMAPIDPRELVQVGDLEGYDPNKILVVTTGSQAEPRAALNLASRGGSPLLKLKPSDLLLYSAKIIPGNDTKVMSMMNNVASLGTKIAMGQSEGLHVSGHAYRGELEEVMKLVKPQHFLPVHGEYAFLQSHAQLARDIGIRNTSVIRNGQMLGVHHRRNARVVSTTGASNLGMQMLGDVKLRLLYNDGNKGTGDEAEMAIEERSHLAIEGLVVAAVDVIRSLDDPATQLDDAAAATGAESVYLPSPLTAEVRLTTRAMWTDNDRLLQLLHTVSDLAVRRLSADASLAHVERSVGDAIRRACREFNHRRPDVVVVAHEMDPRDGATARALQARKQAAREAQTQGSSEKQQQSQSTHSKQQQPIPELDKSPNQEDLAHQSKGQKKGRGRPKKGSSSDRSSNATRDSKTKGSGKRGRPKKAAENAKEQKTSKGTSASPAATVKDLPDEVWQELKANNPRENPYATGDNAYD